MAYVRSEETKRKARVRKRGYRAADPKARYDEHARWRQRSPWARNLASRHCAARKKGIPFSLTAAYTKSIWTGKCAVTGLPFDNRFRKVNKGPQPFAPSLDRIRPERGYVPGNVRFVLQCVNSFKSTMSDRLMARVAERIARCDTLNHL